jgi:sortase B
MSNKEGFYENNSEDNAPADTSEPVTNSEDTLIHDTDSEENQNEAMKESDIQPEKSKKKINIIKLVRILCMAGFIIFTFLFINEVLIQPYRMNKALDLTRDLYTKPTTAPVTVVPITATPTQAPVVTTAPVAIQATPTPDLIHDARGRLLTFKELLESNEDTKGWITIPDTNIDYVVMQSKEDPIYYLYKDFNKKAQKAGCLFLDSNSSVEDNTQNLVIHGHNMKSTDNMFHYLEHFKELDYFKKRTTFTFDSIYQTGQWKIFSIFITNGSSKKEAFFDYTKSTFQDTSEYLNFLYQLRNRSIYNIDTVDINENDQIVTLSTCSYELTNYRLVIVARKLREGEDPTVDAESITVNKSALYPKTYYKNYGGKTPELPDTFEEA